MPDANERDVDDALVDLYDPEKELTRADVDADLEYFQKKLTSALERNAERGVPQKDSDKMTEKMRRQIKLLEEARDAYFKNAEGSSDE